MGLGAALETMQQELLSHMQKEELVLFPAQSRWQPLYCPAHRHAMRHEHTDHGAALEHIVRSDPRHESARRRLQHLACALRRFDAIRVMT